VPKPNVRERQKRREKKAARRANRVRTGKTKGLSFDQYMERQGKGVERLAYLADTLFVATTAKAARAGAKRSFRDRLLKLDPKERADVLAQLDEIDKDAGKEIREMVREKERERGVV
jgi:hypothetical protein